MLVDIDSQVVQLGAYPVLKGQSSVSGFSSGAFMAVQLHLAHSSRFAGVGIVAGGPFRCAESFRAAALSAQDACVQNAVYICMHPLVPSTGPDAARLAQWARDTAQQGLIDPVAHVAGQRVFVFTGTRDAVISPEVVRRTRDFYEQLGVSPDRLAFVDNVPAGHAILTSNPEDAPLGSNQPPYINQGGFMLSHDILRHLHGPLKPPTGRLSGRLVRFDQSEFFDEQPRASMSRFAYAYVPRAVEEGAPARVHIALHGCKQGYNHVDCVHGRPDVGAVPPFGNRYVTTTGYNALADSNNLIVLYPQAEGADDGLTQNPEGCWDWWGYTSLDPQKPDYYSRDAIQIQAIARMLERLGG